MMAWGTSPGQHVNTILSQTSVLPDLPRGRKPSLWKPKDLVWKIFGVGKVEFIPLATESLMWCLSSEKPLCTDLVCSEHHCYIGHIPCILYLGPLKEYYLLYSKGPICIGRTWWWVISNKWITTLESHELTISFDPSWRSCWSMANCNSTGIMPYMNLPHSIVSWLNAKITYSRRELQQSSSCMSCPHLQTYWAWVEGLWMSPLLKTRLQTNPLDSTSSSSCHFCVRREFFTICNWERTAGTLLCKESILLLPWEVFT